MQDDILKKAKELGINTGNGTEEDQLLEVARSVGVANDEDDFNLEELDSVLDTRLKEATKAKEESKSAEKTFERREDYSQPFAKRRERSRMQTASAKLDSVNSGDSDSEEEEQPEEEQGIEEEPNAEFADPISADKFKEFGRKLGSVSAKIGKKFWHWMGAAFTWLMAHPVVLLIIAVVAIIILVVIIIFFMSDEDYSNGYFDAECDYNNTTVVYNCTGNYERMDIDDYVIGAVHAYLKDYDLSAAAQKALMIAIKTTTLAHGSYDNTFKEVEASCAIRFDRSTLTTKEKETLEKYYKSIERYLYISSSYKSAITDLDPTSELGINDEYLKKFASTKKSSYESILREIYGPFNKGESKTEFDSSRETIYIGDSRMSIITLRNFVDNAHSVYNGANGYCWFRYNTNYGSSCKVMWNSNTNDTGRIGAIKAANAKMNNGQSYNIVIWLGVNDLNNLDRYFSVYKELALGEWKNHMIYILQLGPVKESMYNLAGYNVRNSQVQDFNNKMSILINNAGISNLVYLDIGLTQDTINWNQSDGVHYYDNNDNQRILAAVQSSSGSVSSRNLALYDLASYCEFIPNSDNCGNGWWYPIGNSGDYDKGDVLTGPPALLDTGPDNYGYRNDPFTGERKYHSGSDLWANMGMNVVASRAGTIKSINDGAVDGGGNGGGYGNYVVIDHGDGTFTRYGHLKQGSVTKYVSVGMTVRQGQIIGLSGNSGRSTGPHLHFEIRLGSEWGDTENPFNYISISDPRPGGNCKSKNVTSDGSVKSTVCSILKKNGYSDNAVTAILSNIEAESGFRLDAYGDVNIGGSYGLCQWYAGTSRQNNLKSHCPGSQLNTAECQTDFILYELRNSYTGVNNYLKGNHSVEDMTNYFCRNYEVPESCAGRTSYNTSMLNYVKNGCR